MAKALLEGKKGIIFGALDEKSLAWKTAMRAHEEGAQIVLTNAPVAMRLGKINELAEICGAEVIPADATNVKAMEIVGGKVDFVLHSIGMSPNVRKDFPYTDLNHDFFLKTLDISALSFHKILQTAYKQDAISEWGSVVALSYIAAQRTMPGYKDMADAKAMLESIARSFGYYYGKEKKVRVNTISQSPTLTTVGAGIKGFNSFYHYANDIAPLGNASADSCADYIVMLFSDMCKMVTMQNLYHDGGFSYALSSEEALAHYGD